jgi:Tol biopolymer transport system component/serine/threonine protein kinase
MDQVPELIERLQQALGDGFRVTEELGGGGMSRVFVAREVELGRDLVVKVLPPDLGAGLNTERFRREIQLCARLQHPHIVPLLFAGAKNGLLYYSMPRIEGESLRSRISRSGELSIHEAIRLLHDVSDALEYAHAHGVIHRDIKPENILVSSQHALVTDFGVAKALTASTGQSDITSAGIALGTPRYMAPEQATADPMTDHRADIYALGVVGYELLSGQPPFSGASTRQLFASQIIDDPVPISKQRPSVPPLLAQVVMRCLEKRPADRFQSAAEVRERLEILATPKSGTISTTRGAGRIPFQFASRSKMLLKSASVAAMLLVGIIVASSYMRRGHQAFEVGGTEQITNEPGIEITPALSPDGKLIAYAGGQPAITSIFVKQVKGGEPVRVVGGPLAPRWSPDGAKLVYVDSAGLAAMPALGGSAQRLSTPALQTFSPVWSHDGKALAYAAGASIWISNADGTDPRKIIAKEDPHSISWSRDDSRLAFVDGNSVFIYGSNMFGNIAPSAIWIVRRNGDGAERLTDKIHHNHSPVWSPDGSGILYVSNFRGARDLYYQSIQGTRGEGLPQRLTTGLRIHGIAAEGSSIAYSVWNTSAGIWSIPFPRSGPVSFSRVTARQITSATERIESLSLGPDGQWLAFDSDRSGNMDVYKMRIDGTGLEQLTRNTADDFHPRWSPDGRQIAFQSWRSGNRDSYVMSADGSSERLIAGGPSHDFAGTWSPDGSRITFASDRNGGVSGSELFIVPAIGGTVRQLTSQGGLWATWSPDGKLIAYVGGSALRVISPEGEFEKVIVPPSLFGRVTAIGGWSVDGNTIYFRVRAPDGSLHIASVLRDGGNPTILVRFDDPLRGSYHSDFSTDGKNIYVTIGKHEADIWMMDLKKK